MPEAPCRTVTAGAGDGSLSGALIDRQKMNSTNEQEATLDSATLAPPEPAVVEPNRSRGRRDLLLQPAAEELRKRGSEPRPTIASCPALLGEAMALLESRVYASANRHSVAARGGASRRTWCSA